MFTGIIETLGTIKSLQRGNKSITVSILPDYDDYAVSIGGSVSIDGACLTVESESGNVLSFTAVYETLEHTTLAQMRTGARVNLERALRLSDRLEGHVVLGHVDGVGRILNDKKYGDSIYRTIGVPKKLHRFMAHKGSVAIDGISLTITETKDETITVALIPHTLSKTTMSIKNTGNQVNIECDVFARYIYHQLNFNGASETGEFSFKDKEKNKNILSLLEDNEF